MRNIVALLTQYERDLYRDTITHNDKILNVILKERGLSFRDITGNQLAILYNLVVDMCIDSNCHPHAIRLNKKQAIRLLNKAKIGIKC